MSDIYYYNVIVNNTSEERILLDYKDTRIEPILENTSEFQVGVLRFNCPGAMLPMSLFDDTQNLLVKLVYKDCEATYKVEYINRGGPSSRQPLYPNAIYSVQHWIEMINQAYVNCIQLLANTCVDFPPIDPATQQPADVFPPVFTYNPTTQLISIVTEAEYYDYDIQFLGSDYVKVMMNLPLLTRFSTFDTFSAPSVVDPITGNVERFDQIMIRANILGGGTPGFIITTQETIGLSLLSDTHTVVFQSSALPLNNELLPDIGVSRNVVRPILTDFLLPTVSPDRSDLQFIGNGLQVRWIDLVNDLPINTVDIQGYFTNKSETFFPLYIPAYDLFTLKLGFRKKGIYMTKRIDHKIEYNYDSKEKQEEEKPVLLNRQPKLLN